jgi:hypothetical protein
MRLRILDGKSQEAGNMGLARGPSTRLLDGVLVNLAVDVKTLVPTYRSNWYNRFSLNFAITSH